MLKILSVIFNITVGLFNLILALYNIITQNIEKSHKQSKEIFCSVITNKVNPPVSNSGGWLEVKIYNPSKAPIFNVFVISTNDFYEYNCPCDLNKLKFDKMNHLDLNCIGYIKSLNHDCDRVIEANYNTHNVEEPAMLMYFTDCIGKKWLRDNHNNLYKIRYDYKQALINHGMDKRDYRFGSAFEHKVK